MMLFPATQGEGSWRVEFLAGYLAAPGTEQIAEAILNQMVAGCQVNPEWGMQQVRLAGKVSDIWSKANSEISDMIYQGHKNRSQIMDRAYERSARAFRGEGLIEDPNTGQRYEVPSGSNYYFRVGYGNEFIGTETQSPDLPLHYLHQMKIVD